MQMTVLLADSGNFLKASLLICNSCNKVQHDFNNKDQSNGYVKNRLSWVKEKLVDQIMDSLYIQTDIYSVHNAYKEVKQQTRKSACIPGYLRDTTWINKHATFDGKVKICKTIVKAVFTYKADTRRTEPLLKTTEMNTFRNVIGKTRRN